jgi:hypothetical protein
MLVITALATGIASLVLLFTFFGFSWVPPPDPYGRVEYTDEVQTFLKRYPSADISRSPLCVKDNCLPYANVELKYWSPKPEGTAWLKVTVPHSGYESPTFTAWCNRAEDTISPVEVTGERINMTAFFELGQCPPST